MKKSSDKKISKKITASMLAATLLLSTGVASFAASDREAWNNAASTKDTGTLLANGTTVYSNVYADSDAWQSWKNNWNTVRNNFEQIALTPGVDATQMNFAWYSKSVETPSIRITDKDGNPTGQSFYGTQIDTVEEVTENEVTTKLFPNKVTMNGLEENTTYYYQYLADGKFSDTYSFTTKATDSFSVLYVGDPQIGASKGQTPTEENTFANSTEYYARNDAYNWNQTLTNAISNHNNISFILSAGDQINQTSYTKDTDKLEQQVEYAGFLNPSILRSVPVATTIGNHDSKSVNYKNHFNNPNSFTDEVGASVAGNDYYFTYGDALFVVINTNNYNCQTHKELIDKAVSENQNAKWKILMFHQDIYGSGADHSDSDGMVLRTQLTKIIDDAGFDAVLQGHDHTYSRTYQLDSSSETYPAHTSSSDENFRIDNAACYDILTNETDINKVVNPLGTVYFEANSATGSKFYQLIETQQNYIAARSQSWRPTYSVLDFDEVSLTVKTYDAATNEELVADGDIATSYTIVKSVDKTELNEKITEAEAEAAKNDVYTEASIEKLNKVIEEAKKIAAKDDAKTVDVASAYTSIDEAVKALEKIQINDNTNDNGTDDKKDDGTVNNGTQNPSADSITVSDNKVNADNTSNSTVNNPTDNSTSNTTPAKTTVNAATSNPKTGDNGTTFMVSSMVAILSAGALVMFKIKGKKEENEEDEVIQ